MILHVVQCPAKNRTDSKGSDVLDRNDIYHHTELNGTDAKDETEAKPVLAKRKITGNNTRIAPHAADTSFKIPKKSPIPQQAEVPVHAASKGTKKMKPSPPSNGEGTAVTKLPVESPVKPNKKKSAEATSPQKPEKKGLKKPQATDNNKAPGMMSNQMFNNMMQNYAYQQQLAQLQANGNTQGASVHSPNRTYVNSNIKYLPMQYPSNNNTTPQYVNMSLINNCQSNPMLASQLMQNQQYAMLVPNASSPVLKKPSNKKPNKKGENENTPNSSSTQSSQGIIYVTPQQNQIQQQMYANQMNLNMQLFLQRQQQLQLMASKGMLPNTIPNTINMSMSQPSMATLNPNIINMTNNQLPMNSAPTVSSNNITMSSPSTSNSAMNNVTVNNNNMASMNPMMATNTLNLPQNATASAPGASQQRTVPQKSPMASQGNHTHVQQTQTQTINMTPQQYQQITQQQLQHLQLLQQQQSKFFFDSLSHLSVLQNMNAAQQGIRSL